MYYVVEMIDPSLIVENLANSTESRMIYTYPSRTNSENNVDPKECRMKKGIKVPLLLIGSNTTVLCSLRSTWPADYRLSFNAQ